MTHNPPPTAFSPRRAAAARRRWQEQYRQVKVGKAIAMLAALDTNSKRQVLDALLDADALTLHAIVPNDEGKGLACMEVKNFVTNGETIDMWCEGAMEAM